MWMPRPVTSCLAELLLKTLCRAHYKLIIPVPICRHVRTHAFMAVGPRPSWWHMPHIRPGAEIFCPLARRNMKRIIFIIPTPAEGQFPRPSAGRNGLSSIHPASRHPGIQNSPYKIEQPETRIRMESLSERTNNGVCVRKYIYLRALSGITRGGRGRGSKCGSGCGHSYALFSAAVTAAVDTNCQFINAYRAYA